MEKKKAVSLAIIVVLIINLILLGLQKIPDLVFWAIVGIGFILMKALTGKKR